MSEMNNEGLTAYLDAAINMGFEGSSFIDGGMLYLQGDACRLAYQDVPEDSDSPINIDDIECVVQDLPESVPAKMIIAENHEGMNYNFWLQGPVGSGMPCGGDFDDCLLEPIEIEDVEDFKRLYPLVIDVLAVADISPDELKQKSKALHALIQEFQMRQALSEEEAKEAGIL